MLILPTQVYGDIIIVGDEDKSPPELIAFSFSPTTVDTTDGSQTVTFNFHITDDLSGFYYLIFQIKSPSGQQQWSPQVTNSHRISGDFS
jgi:hypothetical protein